MATDSSRPLVEAQASAGEDTKKTTLQSRTLASAQALSRLVLFLACLVLFVLALELMKRGASGAATLIGSFLDVNNVPNALGFGWLATYLELNGSPVAAVSVTFLATGALDQLPVYAMPTGSKLGASFIVLFIGFVYVLRGHEKRAGLTTGLPAALEAH